MDLRIVVRYGLGSGGGHTKRIRCQTGPGHLLGVINERYERGALIVTSNWAFTEWLDLLQSPLLASAALGCLRRSLLIGQLHPYNRGGHEESHPPVHLSHEPDRWDGVRYLRV